MVDFYKHLCYYIYNQNNGSNFDFMNLIKNKLLDHIEANRIYGSND
jgi:hypothetical protein